MNEKFETMMRWSLGDDYGSQDVKQAPEIWKVMHPDLPELKSLANKPSGANAYFFTFQMTVAWLAVNNIQCWIECLEKEKQEKEQEYEKPFVMSVFRVMWSDFMSFFKRNTGSKG